MNSDYKNGADIKLAIVSSHPIQYNAPLFAMLHKRGNLQVKVFYTWGEAVLQNKFDPGFGQQVQWDIPLLNGYDYVFVQNTAKDKGSHHFNGIVNPSLISEIKSWNADAVLVYGWSFRSHLNVMRSFSGRLPVFFRGDSVSLDSRPSVKNWLRKTFLKWVYSHITTAFYVGLNNKDYFIQNGLKEHQLVFAPHAIDIERFRQNLPGQQAEFSSLRKQLSIGARDIVLLYAGKIDRNKNVSLLLEAFTHINQKGVHLLIAGDGPMAKELQEKYAEHSFVHFLPFQNQSQMPELYQSSDVFILPSISETWGLGINEAMACSNAIIASDTCGAARDLVKDNINGYTFRSGDGEDLEKKLLMILSAKGSISAMGKKSMEIIEPWNYEYVCSQIEKSVMHHA